MNCTLTIHFETQGGERVATGAIGATTRPALLSRCDVRTLGKRIVYQTQALFLFKISLVSDEKRELIVSLLIDP